MSVHARPRSAHVSTSPVSRTVPVRSTLWVNVGTREEPEWVSRSEATTVVIESGSLEDVLREIGWVDMEP